MHKVHPNRLGMVVGGFYAIMHVVWSLLVAFGLAEAWIDFFTSMHFVNPTYSLDEFSLLRAVGLVVLAAAVGYIMGALLAVLWNWASRD